LSEIERAVHPIQPLKTFPKKLRLRKRNQFLKVQQKGMRLSTEYLLVYAYLKKDAFANRIGITASKKVGKAHDRNRIKRLIREAFRHSTLRHGQFWDIVVVAKAENPPCDFLALCQDFEQIASQLSQKEKSFKVSR
jgi:ribonuclease P protein component